MLMDFNRSPHTGPEGHAFVRLRRGACAFAASVAIGAIALIAVTFGSAPRDRDAAAGGTREAPSARTAATGLMTLESAAHT
jgi:hypothetical protein